MDLGARTRERERTMVNFFWMNVVMWEEEVSEGAHVGTTTHQGAPGGQVGCAHLVHLPLILFAPEVLKYSEKNRIKFSGHSENFYFWVIFYCTRNSENRQNMAFHFI